jgi:hypothetical protein
MLNDEVKAKIMPQVTKIAEELGDDESIIIDEFETRFNTYIEKGIEEKLAIKTALNSLRASYNRLVKLGAKMYEGFFIAAIEKSDSNMYAAKCAKKIVDDMELGDHWKTLAVEHGLMNKKGEYIYTEAVWKDNGRENEKMKWRIGKPITVQYQKEAWGFFRESGSDGPLELIHCYISDPDSFAPEFGKMYKFRAVKKVTGAGNIRLDFKKNISNLIESDITFSIRDVEDYIEEIPENVIRFEDAYDMDEKIGILPEFPAPRFCITEGQIGTIEETEYGKKKISIIEDSDDLDGDIITFEMPNEYCAGLYEGSVGIMSYRPFFKNNKETQEKEPAGSLLGFVVNDAFRIDFDDVEINDEPIDEEEYD